MCNMYIWWWWEVGWFDGLTELLFRGGRQTGAGARFGWMGGLTGLLFLGDAEWARGAIPLDVFVSLWVE